MSPPLLTGRTFMTVNPSGRLANPTSPTSYPPTPSTSCRSDTRCTSAATGTRLPTACSATGRSAGSSSCVAASRARFPPVMLRGQADGARGPIVSDRQPTLAGRPFRPGESSGSIPTPLGRSSRVPLARAVSMVSRDPVCELLISVSRKVSRSPNRNVSSFDRSSSISPIRRFSMLRARTLVQGSAKSPVHKEHATFSSA